jgi:hypothetical protein
MYFILLSQAVTLDPTDDEVHNDDVKEMKEEKAIIKEEKHEVKDALQEIHHEKELVRTQNILRNDCFTCTYNIRIHNKNTIPDM